MTVDVNMVALVTVIATNLTALARLLILTTRTRRDDEADRKLRDEWRREIDAKLDTLTQGAVIIPYRDTEPPVLPGRGDVPQAPGNHPHDTPPAGTPRSKQP